MCEELVLCGKELVAGSAETLKYLNVHSLWSKANGLPFSLNVYNLLCLSLPVGAGLALVGRYHLYLLAQFALLCKILLFLLTYSVEVVSVTFVHHCACSFEACPYLVAQLLCHRTDLTILVVQFL